MQLCHGMSIRSVGEEKLRRELLSRLEEIKTIRTERISKLLRTGLRTAWRTALLESHSYLLLRTKFTPYISHVVISEP